MINWSVPIIAFFLAAILGATLGARFQARPGWGKRRRLLSAALPLPALIVAASAAGVLFELLRARTGITMTDLAIAVYVGLGGLFAIVTLAGGLVGAALAESKTAR